MVLGFIAIGEGSGLHDMAHSYSQMDTYKHSSLLQIKSYSCLKFQSYLRGDVALLYASA